MFQDLRIWHIKFRFVALAVFAIIAKTARATNLKLVTKLGNIRMPLCDIKFTPENPFYYLKVRHLFGWMILISFGLAIQIVIINYNLVGCVSDSVTHRTPLFVEVA
jgi:hypothetical protein